MNPISIFCPVTNQSVDTGIETNWSTFFELRPFRMRVRCPQCGGQARDGGARRLSGALGSRRSIRGRPQENPQIESLLAKLPQN